MYINVMLLLSFNECKLYYIFCLFADVGYSFVWDNTQMEQKARHQTRTSTNKMMLWANSFAVQNRVPVDHSLSLTTHIKAMDIPLTNFIPNNDTYSTIMDRMIIIVTRILTQHITSPTHISTVSHIQHQHSEETAKKSIIVRTCNTLCYLH